MATHLFKLHNKSILPHHFWFAASLWPTIRSDTHSYKPMLVKTWHANAPQHTQHTQMRFKRQVQPQAKHSHSAASIVSHVRDQSHTTATCPKCLELQQPTSHRTWGCIGTLYRSFARRNVMLGDSFAKAGNHTAERQVRLVAGSSRVSGGFLRFRTVSSTDQRQ
eukprot:340101-Amphidinium_carterae.1